MQDLEIRYTDMLETAFNFLNATKGVGNGTPLHPNRRSYVFASGGQCLHCGLILTKKNSNTEHIHDLALGGKNHDVNKILMCKTCNSLRNQLMQLYLGTPSFHKGFPGNWDRVKKYLLWNAITADEGHEAGNIFPQIHRLFEELLESQGCEISPPSSYFGRGNFSNLVQIKNTSKSTGFFTRIFDRLFGFKEQQIETYEIRETQPLDLTQNDSIISPVTINPEFIIQTTNVLESIDGEINLSQFTKLFRENLLDIGIGNLTFKEYANSMGIPKSRSCIQIIDQYFDGVIGYRREGNTVFIWLNRGVLVTPMVEEE